MFENFELKILWGKDTKSSGGISKFVSENIFSMVATSLKIQFKTGL